MIKVEENHHLVGL